jgi:protein-disulfide isomerase
MRLSFLMAIVFVAAALMPAQTQPAAAAASQPAATSLPSEQELDAALRRNLGWDSSVNWEIYEIRQSPIAGIADVFLSIKGGAPMHLFVSSDRQYAIAGGDLIPFGPNPYAPAREKLRGADGPARGPATPTINIVVFSDLQCPHCKAAEPVLNKLAAEFPQVRLIFQQFPLTSIHPWAMKAAQYADCAGRSNPAAFWKFVDSIYDTQAAIAPETAETKLKELATAAGLNAQQIAACAADPQTTARVNKSIDLGKSLEVNQTPTVFINGRRVLAVANMAYEQLTSIVNFEIANAGK